MRIVFLRSSGEDVRWFSRYYRRIFRAGSMRASERMRKTLDLLRANPLVGSPGTEMDERRLVVRNTPFVPLYRIAGGRIEILRVLDGRANQTPTRSPDEGQAE